MVQLVAKLTAGAGAAATGAVVLCAPYDYQVSPTTVLQPNVLVARRENLGEARLERTPLLVVEVLSPSTRFTDLGATGDLLAQPALGQLGEHLGIAFASDERGEHRPARHACTSDATESSLIPASSSVFWIR